MPRISTIIPVYNGEKFLAQTLESVRSQTETDWELIIIDDGSNDGTLTIAMEYMIKDRRIKVIRQSNQGVCETRNRGLKEIDPTSEYVNFLDADDVLRKDAYASLVKSLVANTQAVAAHGREQWINSQSHLISENWLDIMTNQRWKIDNNRARLMAKQEPTSFCSLVLINTITTPGQVLIRHSALKQVGGFATEVNISPAADWDLWLRLSLNGYIQFVDEIVLNYRRHEDNMSKNVNKMREAQLMVTKKLISSKELTVKQRKLARDGFRWRYWYISRFYWAWTKDAIKNGRWWSAAKLKRHVFIELGHFYWQRIVDIISFRNK